MKKNNSGITLLALIIMIIVLIIIASISVYEGKELIEKSKVQTIETNMLTIQAKAKAYAEEIEAKIWVKDGETKETARNNEFQKKGFNYKTNNEANQIYSSQINSDITVGDCISYTISSDGLKDMGLEDISTETYIVVFDKTDYKKIDVIFPNDNKGIRYNKKTYYTLSSLQNALTE